MAALATCTFLLALPLAQAARAQAPVCILRWGSNGGGDGQFNGPTEADVDPSGNVYVTDTRNHRIQKFDGNGDFLLKWGLNFAGPADGQFNQPQGIAVDHSDVYVADMFNHRVQKFDSNGGFLLKWGSLGTGDGQFSFPYGVAVDSIGHVYVVDSNNHRIQKFDGNGGFILTWGSQGECVLNGPTGIAVDPTGSCVYVASANNHCLEKFGPDLTGAPPVREGSVFTLRSIAPNPSSGLTSIQYEIAHNVSARLEILDVSGRRVRTLTGQLSTSGGRSVIWDGRADDGRVLASGVYLVRLASNAETRSLRAVRLR